MTTAWTCPACPHDAALHTEDAQGCGVPDCLCFYLPPREKST